MSKYIDVFNGDADGIFSLIQWRKAYPLTAQDQQILITGVKRDIALVSKIDDELAHLSKITVLDISFDKNQEDVNRVLEHCQSLFYCDHHKADSLFEHPKLTSRINTKPTVCTGLLVNGELKGEHSLWAIAAAFGDGLDSIADKYVAQLGLDTTQRHQLKELGVLVNYNGYGSSVDDLHFSPEELYKRLVSYDTPFDVIADENSPFRQLKEGYETDITQAKNSKQLSQEGVIAVILDDAPWARRISGTYGNQLAAENPSQPVIIVTLNAQGSYTISLRAPKEHPHGASTICSKFATGGGREGAAGINELPIDDLDKFLTEVARYYK